MNPIYRWIAAGAGLLVAGFLIWYFQAIVFYVLIAAVLSLIGKPLVRLICRIRIGRWSPPKWLAALLTLTVMLLVITTAARLLVPVVIGKLNHLSGLNIQQLAETVSAPLRHIENYINEFLPERSFSFQEYFSSWASPVWEAQALGQSILSVTEWIVNLGIAIFSVGFITFFFLKDDTLFYNGVVLFFPDRHESHIRRALDSSITLLTRYFIGICIEISIILTGLTLLFLLIGFDLSTAIVVGLIAAILNVIPYLGPLMGGIIGCIIGLLTPVAGVATGTLLVEMIGSFLLIQAIDNVVLQPSIYSSSVKAHPLEIFIVILMAGYMAGILGMLLAIPAYTVLRVFAKEFFNRFRMVQKLTEKI